MSKLLMLLVLLLAPLLGAQLASAGSCEGYCGSKGSTGDCWCDAACTKYGDCCDDA